MKNGKGMMRGKSPPSLVIGMMTGKGKEKADEDGEESAPDDAAGMAAARGMLKAMERRDPGDVLEAFKALFRHCDELEDKGEYPEGEES